MKEPKAAGIQRTSDAVLHNIEADLRAGRIKLGDQLPGERTLAETYGISRASVREAIRILDVMGVVRTSAGSGPKSGAIVISEPSAGLSSALRLHVATNRLPVADIVQTRILLETWAAQTAALRDEAPDVLERAGQLLQAMDEPDVDRAMFHTLDAQFHVALSSLAGNAVIETMMDSLSGSIRGYSKDAMEGFEAWPEIQAVLRFQHHSIFEAVQARDGELAARLLREHIEWFYAQRQRA
ncbi:FCD domain-containing protein [Micrococcaceae bacterium Sec5.7]